MLRSTSQAVVLILYVCFITFCSTSVARCSGQHTLTTSFLSRLRFAGFVFIFLFSLLFPFNLLDDGRNHLIHLGLLDAEDRRCSLALASYLALLQHLVALLWNTARLLRDNEVRVLLMAFVCGLELLDNRAILG